MSGNNLYMASRATGNLVRLQWNGGAPAGPATTVSGPTINGQDWRAKVTFIGP